MGILSRKRPLKFGPFFWNTIYGAEGDHDTPYMTRFGIGRLRVHIFYRGDEDPDPHDHPWAFWTFPLTSYVEEVLLPARQAWAEGLPEPQARYYTHRQVVKAFQLHYREATHTHRVIGRFAGYQTYNWGSGAIIFPPKPIDELITNGRKVITIVWRGGKKERPWGFLKNRDGQWCWVPWKQYVFGGGKNAPCGDE